MLGRCMNRAGIGATGFRYVKVRGVMLALGKLVSDEVKVYAWQCAQLSWSNLYFPITENSDGSGFRSTLCV